MMDYLLRSAFLPFKVSIGQIHSSKTDPNAVAMGIIFEAGQKRDVAIPPTWNLKYWEPQLETTVGDRVRGNVLSGVHDGSAMYEASRMVG
jgi:hypothetical protein